MTEKILILLDQTLFFIQGIQITFIYYYGMRPRRWAESGPNLTPEKIWAGYCYALFGIMLDCMLLAAMDNAAVRRDKEAELAELEMLRKQELQYIIYDNARREELSSIKHELGNQHQI